MKAWFGIGRARRGGASLHYLIVLTLLVGLVGSASIQPATAAAARYPDLFTTKPSSLYFSRVTMSDGVSHHVLRFSNTVWNVGEGRLELQGDPRASGGNAIFQNIYDAVSGGSRVAQFQVSSDLIYHPSHFHYHFSDFASYRLLQRDAAGAYRPTTLDGTKTSFCIIDYARLNASGPTAPRYTSCSGTLQGLSVGWGDTYVASLPEQWVDLGSAPLANGSYAVQSTVDPLGKLNEAGRTGNNVATTYFNVQNGVITIGSSTSPPPSGGGQVGRVVNTGGASLNCRATPVSGTVITRLAAGATVPVTGAVQNGWYPVTCGGRAGWVSAAYLQVTGGPATPPPPPNGTIGTVMNTGGASLNCRTTPGGAVITRLAAGTSVPVTGALQNGWYPVTCGGRNGWVSATYLRVDDGTTTVPPEGMTATVINTGAASLYCRATPGGSIITSLPAGTVVTVTGPTQGGWVPIVCADRSGWASAAYLRVSGSATPTPSPTVTPTGTPAAPTATPPVSTATTAPPTQAPPTSTAPPPTSTTVPPTQVPPTATATIVPPTLAPPTPVPATATPTPTPTATPDPASAPTETGG